MILSKYGGVARQEMTYGKENKNVTFGLSGVNLKDGGNGSMKIVSFGLGCIMDIHGVPTTRH